MKTKVITTIMITLFLASMALSVAPSSALAPKFEYYDTGVCIRMPQKAIAGKPFSIGIYVLDDLVSTDTDGSGGDPDLAELYISVSGPIGWNDWFVADNAWEDPDGSLSAVSPWISGDETYVGDLDSDNLIGSDEDLIVPNYVDDPDGSLSAVSPWISGDEHIVDSVSDYGAQSKLEDQDGWSGATVWIADAGTYTFTLKDASLATIAEFDVVVS